MCWLLCAIAACTLTAAVCHVYTSTHHLHFCLIRPLCNMNTLKGHGRPAASDCCRDMSGTFSNALRRCKHCSHFSESSANMELTVPQSRSHTLLMYCSALLACYFSIHVHSSGLSTAHTNHLSPLQVDAINGSSIHRYSCFSDCIELPFFPSNVRGISSSMLVVSA